MLLVTSEFDYFDVATIICKISLKFPRLKDFLLISTLLSSSLDNLTRKGFPVERIFNLKQSKIDQRRKVRIEADSVTSDENFSSLPQNEKEYRANNPEMDRTISELKNIFPDADHDFLAQFVLSMWPSDIPSIVDKLLEVDVPKKRTENQTNLTTGQKTIDNLFQSLSNVTKQLGILDISESYGGNKPQKNKNITPFQTKLLEKKLKSSILKSRSTTEENIKGDIGMLEQPQTINNCCSVLTDTDLELHCFTNNIPFYIDKRALEEGKSALSTNPASLTNFSQVLIFLGKVFDCPLKAIHIYWDHNAKTVAFNRNRSLFFNLRFYIGLHHSNDPSISFYSLSSERPSCFYYWYMTFCHELAHHFVIDHDAQHENYMSSFAETYMGKLIKSMSLSGIKSYEDH